MNFPFILHHCCIQHSKKAAGEAQGANPDPPRPGIPRAAWSARPAGVSDFILPADQLRQKENRNVSHESIATGSAVGSRRDPNEVVEIVFVPAEQYLAALAKDGKVTFRDLKKMDLVVGLADYYLEVQKVADPDVPGEGFSRTVIASGVLEDGRPFFVRHARTPGAYNIEFEFGE